VFPLKVSKSVFRKIIEQASGSKDGRVIGFLLGRFEGKIMVIDDAVTGKITRGESTVSLTGEAIAKIADKVIREGKNTIVGWYHTHPGYEVYMSDVDEKTQKVLNQFSPYVVSLVLDPVSGKHKFYSSEYGRSVPIPERNVSYFEPPPSRGGKIEGERRAGKPLTKKQLYTLVISLLLIGLVTAGFFILSYAKFGQTFPSITHTPVSSAVVGSSVTLKAKVTGGVGGIANVTLNYQWSRNVKAEEETASIRMPWKRALMLLVAAGGDEYAYTIPSSEVQGDINYFIVAIDNAGNRVSTSVYTIKVKDFGLKPLSDSVTVYLGESRTVKIKVFSISGFSSKVRLKTARPPYGLEAYVSPSLIALPAGGSAVATLTLKAKSMPGTFRGAFELEVYGESGKAEHSTTVTVTVPNFDFSVNPKTRTIRRGETATYTVELKPAFNFNEEVTFSLSGLPDAEASWKLTLLNNKIKVSGPMTLSLEVSTTKNVETGTYALTLKAEGGGIKLQEALTLVITK